MNTREVIEAFTRRLVEGGFDQDAVARHPSETLVPAETAKTLVASTPRTGASPLEVAGERVQLLGTLGEGGMGIVRLGKQPMLNREVAVKTLRAEHRGDAEILKMLREAWITGLLEHPNIVPVHDLLIGEDGCPSLVLKKIDGVAWSELIRDEASVREMHGAQHLLEWNLRTLMQVCNAIHFAHSRGIVHRDVKPANVMVGSFGEVYVVDWGIAVSLDDDGTGRLPLATSSGVAGTPMYMAPELVNQRPASERTDVYLLGACLFEIATGRPPHRGDNLMQIVSSSLASPPDVPSEVSEPLARIIERAMALVPEDRFASADALRLALLEVLERRDATTLAEAAQRQLAELEASLGIGASDESRQRARHLFGACRFGFKQSLAIWPENADAAAGLRRATVRMIEHALETGEPDAAAAWLGDLDDPEAALQGRVDDARRQAGAERAALERAASELDPSRGRALRFTIAAIAGAVFVLAPLLFHVIHTLGFAEPASWQAFPVYAVLFLLSLGLGTRLEELRDTIFNRTSFGALLVALGAPMVVSGLDLAASVPWQATGRTQLLAWSIVCAMLASVLDRRLLLPAAGYVVAAGVLVVVPDALFLVMAGANSLLAATLLLLWRGQRGGPDRQGPRSERGTRV